MSAKACGSGFSPTQCRARLKPCPQAAARGPDEDDGPFEEDDGGEDDFEDDEEEEPLRV